MRLPRTVLALGFVSLLTDLSSEMIYPLLPLFLSSTLGAGPAVLGLIEGLAESAAALLKLVSGVVSDGAKRRKPFVLAGYTLSGLVRPLVGLAMSWPMVAAIRLSDRIGKGLRSSPRDAIIADVTPEAQRGAAFGLHRAMDHAGAVLGPLVAAGLLLLGVPLRTVFLLAAVPAVAVLLTLVFAVHEPPPRPASERPRRALAQLWRSSPELRRLLAAILIFTLGNSTDAFLLLALSDAGLPAAWIAVLWSAHHAVKMVASSAAGGFSDRVGRRPLVLAGWLLYAAVYAAFAGLRSPEALVVVFLVYGIYFGLTEATERAWVADLAPPELRGSAFGAYHAAIGIAALPASLLFGWLWQEAGRSTAFAAGALLALAACGLVTTVPTRRP